MHQAFLEFVVELLRTVNPFVLLRSQHRRELLEKWRKASIPERLAYSVLVLSALALYGLGCSLVVIIVMAANKSG